MKTVEPVDIIIPTYNNPSLLSQCVSSLLAMRRMYPINILIVNNGHQQSTYKFAEAPNTKVIQTGDRNLGWEGGLQLGLEHSKSSHVCFMNDDTYIVPAQMEWLRQLMSIFGNKEVAGVGPSSNCVMGPQNIWKGIPNNIIQVTYLIGFCAVYDRAKLDEVGGVDNSLPGGDDLDLSIRLRNAGYSLVARRDVFVFHHGFVTGNSIYGNHTRKGGWNSTEMTERTDMALMKKHGFRKWFECKAGLEYPGLKAGTDNEGEIIREWIQGDLIYDLGCANNKTVQNAIGIDIVEKGKEIPNLNAISEADIQADVENDLNIDLESADTIIARHILEHCIDPIDVLTKWISYLKPGGRLILAVPDETMFKSIGFNVEHVHAYTAQSLSRLCQHMGLLIDDVRTSDSASIIVVCKKKENLCK